MRLNYVDIISEEKYLQKPQGKASTHRSQTLEKRGRKKGKIRSNLRLVDSKK